MLHRQVSSAIIYHHQWPHQLLHHTCSNNRPSCSVRISFPQQHIVDRSNTRVCSWTFSEIVNTPTVTVISHLSSHHLHRQAGAQMMTERGGGRGRGCVCVCAHAPPYVVLSVNKYSLPPSVWWVLSWVSDCVQSRPSVSSVMVSGVFVDIVVTSVMFVRP